ncbi:hypothetical protein CEXT_349941 [Caerostris extrusa]|uniref:Uncharacterized protein n=1 Tax=Caerostris extrusa TaxID=172846 RepID=A0AAV4MU34_CAEEX|nr:hypothetical protein CEXT_349941 [Caerostris extrusa]
MIGTALALRKRNEILKKEKRELNKRSLKWKREAEEKGNSDDRNKENACRSIRQDCIYLLCLVKKCMNPFCSYFDLDDLFQPSRGNYF